MSYYLGLDVGGTKTQCLIADRQGNLVGFGCGATGNYEYEGIEPAALENRKAVEAALEDAQITLEQVGAIGMGVAGADLPQDYVMLEEAIYTPLFGTIPRSFKNDSIAGLYAGTHEASGVVVACGTGCTAAGISPTGEEARVGGLGAEFGDACTGVSLGQEGLRAVWRARDEITPPTLLTAHFLKRAGLDDVDILFDKMYNGHIHEADLDPMAKIVFDAAVDRDPTACDILRLGGLYLGAMANAVAKKLNMIDDSFDVVLAGSVYKGRSRVLINAMESVVKGVSPKALLVKSPYGSVVGALFMAYRLDNVTSDALYDKIESELPAIEQRHKVTLKVV